MTGSPVAFVVVASDARTVRRAPGVPDEVDERVLGDDELLAEAVEARLRARTDPYLLLSGGLDSTLVAATARRHGSRDGDLRALSMQFEDPAAASDESGPPPHRTATVRIGASATGTAAGSGRSPGGPW